MARYRNALILFLAAFFLPLPAQAATYDVDPAHTRLGFAVKHMVISTVRGEFQKFSGVFEMNDDGALTGAEASVDVASLNTRDEKRDNHLRSPDFFDVEKFPEMKFVAKEITRDGNGYTVKGDLTIKDVTRTITLTGEKLGEAVDPWGAHRAGFHAEGKINRKDFNVNFHKLLETGGLVVGDEVTIELDIEGVKRGTPPKKQAAK
ncbi:MAG: YceI family protein [Candidatus Nitrospinota bacterium M3_3B_026]